MVFLITKELISGFQILDLKDHFSASLNKWLNKTYWYEVSLITWHYLVVKSLFL